MTQPEYAAILADMVTRNVITQAQADQLLADFDGVNANALPLTLDEATQPVADEENALIFLSLLLLLNRKFVPDGRLPLRDRERLRNGLRSQFGGDMNRHTARLLASGNVQRWHADTRTTLGRYVGRQYGAGLGRQLTARDLAAFSGALGQQYSYLYRFAGELSVRFSVGEPYSSGRIGARLIQYGGLGYGLWFAGNEADERTTGMVAVYEDRDDRGTCRPCRAAGAVRYYLPGDGPMPGQVCVARGHCRCRRFLEHNPAVYERLTG